MLKFTGRADKVLQFAYHEAIRMGHDMQDTGHLLVGLIQEGSGVAANVLKNLDINLCKVREVFGKISLPPSTDQKIVLPLKHSFHEVINKANEFATKLNHDYIGTEHLLLGLCELDAGMAPSIFKHLQIPREVISQECLTILGFGDNMEPLPNTDQELAKTRQLLTNIKVKIENTTVPNALTALYEIYKLVK